MPVSMVALASSSDRVEIVWDQHLDGVSRKLAVQWSELKGPEVCEPKRKGFGLSLVKKALKCSSGIELRAHGISLPHTGRYRLNCTHIALHEKFRRNWFGVCPVILRNATVNELVWE
jgi:hypothetical protein